MYAETKPPVVKVASSGQLTSSACPRQLRSDQIMGFLFHQKRQRGKIPWRRTWRQRRRPATPTHQLRALLRAFPRLPLLARGAGAPSKAAGPRAGGPLDGWCVVRWPTQGRQRRRILVCRTRLAAAPFWALQLAPLNVQVVDRWLNSGSSEDEVGPPSGPWPWGVRGDARAPA